MITAYGDEQNYNIAKNLGADDYFTKPLEFNELKTRLTQLEVV
jgi:DNA-binding response OmpR family regulator